MSERIQKLISEAGLMSRRAAEQAIAEDRVLLNGRPAALGDKADPEIDEIRVDGEKLVFEEKKRYLMLNKPKGYVTSMQDEKGRRCVAELVRGAGARVYPVGRLDMYSEGLLLFTNDGEFANRVMHPSHELEKCYHTFVSGTDLPNAVKALRGPMEIDGYRIRPAKVELLEMLPDGAVLAITIHEGRNRQVRKMCSQAGLKVKRLVRVSEGGLCLGDLRPGAWRELTSRELDLLFAEGKRE